MRVFRRNAPSAYCALLLLVPGLLARLAGQRAIALERDLRAGVGLLALDAPVAQVGEGDRLAGDGAAHEVAGGDDLELAVEIAQSRLAPEAEQTLKPIHASLPSATEPSLPPATLHHSAQRRPRAAASRPAER